MENKLNPLNEQIALMNVDNIRRRIKSLHFQQRGDLVARNIFVFLFTASRAVLQSHAEFNRLL